MKITFKGNPVQLQGTQLQIGETMRDFTVFDHDLSPVTLKDTGGMRIFLAVPSLDTPVCDFEVARFNEELREKKGIVCYTISLDLPFAQSRWCAQKGIENVITLSDYKERSFAGATGTYITELGLLTRAAFVVNEKNRLLYVEYVPEVADHPNFAAILKASGL